MVRFYFAVVLRIFLNFTHSVLRSCGMEMALGLRLGQGLGLRSEFGLALGSGL